MGFYHCSNCGGIIEMAANGYCPCLDDKQKAQNQIIKTATPEELLQNEAVKELVEALEFVACRLDYRPTNKATCEVAAIQALKKFEVEK